MVTIAGHGPPPKDPSKRARTNSDPGGRRKYTRAAAVVEQPPLPTFYVFDERGDKKKFVWPEVTRQWWRTWAEEPLSVDFTATDWDYLKDTALLHARIWRYGEMKLLPELRLRVGKVGATIEDRQRLRIDYVPAQDAEGPDPSAGSGGARARRGPLTAV